MKKIAAILFSLILAACAGTNFDWDTARQIKEGMSEAEVVRLMGNPTASRATENGIVYAWTHVNGMTMATKTVSVVFKDGKVVSAPSIPDSYK